MKEINILLILLKLLKRNFFNKEEVSSNTEKQISDIDNNPVGVIEVYTCQDGSVPSSNIHSGNETLQESSTTAGLPDSCNEYDLENEGNNQATKEKPLIIENIPDLNDDGIIDIRDVIIAVIQAIEKYDDFNNY